MSRIQHLTDKCKNSLDATLDDRPSSHRTFNLFAYLERLLARVEQKAQRAVIVTSLDSLLPSGMFLAPQPPFGREGVSNS